MNETIRAISYEEYLEISSLRNGYNDTLAKCHLYNYGCVIVETIMDVTDVMEVEDVEYLDDGIKREIINQSEYILK